MANAQTAALDVDEEDEVHSLMFCPLLHLTLHLRVAACPHWLAWT